MQHIISIALFNNIEDELYTESLVFRSKESFLKGVISFLYNFYIGEDYDLSLAILAESLNSNDENNNDDMEDYTLVVANAMFSEYKKYMSLPFSSENINKFMDSLFAIFNDYEIKHDFVYLPIE